jgi:prevent-host-death family protein
MPIKIIPISELRNQIKAGLEEAERSGVPIFITRYGQPEAVLLSKKAYDALVVRLADMGGSEREVAEPVVGYVIEEKAADGESMAERVKVGSDGRLVIPAHLARRAGLYPHQEVKVCLVGEAPLARLELTAEAMDDLDTPRQVLEYLDQRGLIKLHKVAGRPPQLSLEEREHLLGRLAGKCPPLEEYIRREREERDAILLS